ncbi:MAG: hypothetical protein HY331_03405 [Chloroflexi bacterium]|nr:hypothetical protein [Chloroflexota bacterium]
MAARYKRKNLMVDETQIRRLAAARNVSESEAVRQAVANELEADAAMDAWDMLCQAGGLADPMGLIERE